MNVPQLTHQSLRVLVNVSILLLLTLLTTVPTQAQDSRTGTLLYDVDFSSPYHTIGTPPTQHGQSQPPPREGPSNVTGDPTVASTVGALINQPCRYGQISNYDALRFITGLNTHYPDGFEELYDTYHLELNLLFQEMDVDSSFKIIMDKHPNGNFNLHFMNGYIVAFPADEVIGNYTPGVPIFVEVDMDLNADIWTVSLDEMEVYSAHETMSEIAYIRMQGPRGLYTLAMDDIIICGNGECHTDPYISSHPVSGIGCEGAAFSFSVTAEGTLPLSYLWFKNGVEMTGETSSSLTFDPVEDSHADVYYVRVANVVDTVFSNQVTLTVYEPVAIGGQPTPSSQTVCEGAIVSYGVGQTGTPPFSYQWRRDGEDIDGATNVNITINPVTVDDDGVYDVVVSNYCNSVTSNQVTLTVHSVPVFTLHPQSQTLCIGDDATFSCNADGIPDPTFQWYHDSSPIGTGGTSVTINGLTADDAGSYWVTAISSSNCDPAYSSTAQLQVLPSQVIVPDNYATIQSAINAVCFHDGEIIIRDGTYSGVGNYNLDLGSKQLNIHSESYDPRAVTIACGWNGRGFIISGGQGNETIISGLTIMSGDAGTANGGGIFCQGTSPIIDNCIIKSCVASSGGGMAGDSFSGSLVNCTFYDNYCDNYGGGLYLYNSSEPTPTGNCTFYGNEATRGSGICVDNSMLFPLFNTIITAGIANSTPGEAVHCRNSGLIQLLRSDVWDNAPPGCDWLDCLTGQDPLSNPGLQNRSTDPLFCDELDEDFTLQIDSPCSADNSGVGQIGAWPVGCGIADDDETFEFGIEWVNNYSGSVNDLWLCDDDADYIDSTLRAHSWTRGFKKGNGDADVDHWAEGNNDWVDDVDLALFRGHGSESFDWSFSRDLWGPYFKEPRWWESFDHELTPGDADDCYGDDDVEWVGFGCCRALRNSNGAYWARAFDGAHLIMGYHTNANHVSYGEEFIRRLVSDGPGDPAKRVAWSWFKACDLKMDSEKKARVIGETTDMKYDYVWGQEAGPKPDPTDDGEFTYWDHQKGLAYEVPELTRAPRESSMNYYAVVPRVIDETYVENLGNSLGIYGSVANYGGNYYMSAGDLYLEVDAVEGVDFGDLSKLWLPYDSAPDMPTLPEAQQYVETFFSTNSVLPIDALVQPDLLYSDVQGRADKMTGAVIEEYPTDIQVSFKREINSYPVVGPGSICLTYVSELGGISGLTRIWRDYSLSGSIDIYDSTAVMELFDSWRGRAAVGSGPIIQDYTLTGMSLGYYEMGFGELQDHIFPVYMLFLDITNDGEVEQDVIFVPAAEMFVPLIPEIESPPDQAIRMLGEAIQFEGAAHYGTSPYSDYVWSSDLDGSMGSGPAIDYSTLSAGIHTITLFVQDDCNIQTEAMIDLLISDSADFGDAPDPGYPTLLASGGAAHHLVPTIYLGSQIDAESDGQPDAAASGDDLTDLADEDGIVFGAALAPGLTTPIVVTTSASGYLNGWLDFNCDSDWEDEGEQLFVDVPLDSGQTSLNIEVPEDAVREETFARFRFSTRSGLSFIGTAPDGEVEDYRVAVVCELDSLEGCLPENEPCGQRLNNGCNLDPPAFIPISCGDLYCGQTSAENDLRDSDWFEMQVDEPTRIRIFFEGEFETYVGLIDQTIPGVQGCENLGDDAQFHMIVDSCEVGYLEADLPVAGYYYLIALPLVYNGYPCSSGPFMYHFGVECLSLQPVVSITSDGSNSYLTWEAVDGADYYKVYSADDPYAVFPDDWMLETPAPPGIEGTSWSEPITTGARFYRIVAVAEYNAGASSGFRGVPGGFSDRAGDSLKRLPEVSR